MWGSCIACLIRYGDLGEEVEGLEAVSGLSGRGREYIALWRIEDLGIRELDRKADWMDL